MLANVLFFIGVLSLFAGVIITGCIGAMNPMPENPYSREPIIIIPHTDEESRRIFKLTKIGIALLFIGGFIIYLSNHV